MKSKKITEITETKKIKKIKRKPLKESKIELNFLLKELVGNIAGIDNARIVDIIFKTKPVNEFKIAEKLALTINQTRNILYKLSAQTIVNSTRKKDAKKGWYIYSWSINTAKALAKFIEYKTNEIKRFESLLNSRKTKEFYKCPSNCLETTAETAMLYEFKCPECGSLLQPEKFEQEIEDMGNRIECAKEQIATIQEELDRINEIKERREIKKMVLEKAKKAEARRAKAAKTRKEKLRLLGKSAKKLKKKLPKKKVLKKKLKKKVSKNIKSKKKKSKKSKK